MQHPEGASTTPSLVDPQYTAARPSSEPLGAVDTR
jgi:hypothetical protein